MDTFPDLGSLTDQELKDLIQQLTEEELEISYRRRILHGKIDILRAELVNRLRKKHEGGEEVITGADVQRLTDILAGRAGRRRRAVASAARPSAVALHCPECGFVNAEGANYCPKCGAYIGARPSPRARTSRPRRTDRRADRRDRARRHRRGGGRRRRARHPLRRRPGGRDVPADGERMSIGRSPESDIFLDDVTVSRDHAVLVRRAGDWYLDDCGSLNGTYVNRQRIDSHQLEDGDELQVGKYKLTYLAR